MRKKSTMEFPVFVNKPNFKDLAALKIKMKCTQQIRIKYKNYRERQQTLNKNGVLNLHLLKTTHWING